MNKSIHSDHRHVARARAMVLAALLTLVIVTPGRFPDSDDSRADALPSVSSGLRVPAAPSVPAPSSDPAVPAQTSIEPPAEATLTMARSRPIRLQVPTIGIDSGLMDLGLRADGTLEVPPEGFPAGWFTGASAPGELGPAIIAGHVDWGGDPGIFFDLRYLEAGAEVTVEREDGSTAVFRVTQVQQFPKDNFPTDVVYGDIDHAGLRLITCGGSFDRDARSYVDNIVAFAELISFSTV